MAITTSPSSCLSVLVLVLIIAVYIILNRADPLQPPGSLHLDGALVDVETPENIKVVVLLSAPKLEAERTSYNIHSSSSSSLVHFDAEMAGPLGPNISGLSVQNRKLHGRRQLAARRQHHLRKLMQREAREGKEIGGCKYGDECSSDLGREKKDHDMEIESNMTLPDSRREHKRIRQVLENYRFPRRKMAFSSDRMVPTGPNPLHNSSISGTIP